jgi:hypothetical protein
MNKEEESKNRMEAEAYSLGSVLAAADFLFYSDF